MHDNEMQESGIDIIVGLVETYGSKGSIEQIEKLEIMPLKEVNYKDVVLKEMKLEGILKRNSEEVVYHLGTKDKK